MRITIVCTLVVLLACFHQSSAWFFRRKKDNGERSGFKKVGDGVRKVGDGVKKAVKTVGDGVRFASEAGKGSVEMAKAYKNMRIANWKNSDKYFHARGNHDAAKHGKGGRWAAEKISNLREAFDQHVKGGSPEDRAADQEANKWGRDGNDPNKYRPKGLPDKY